MIPPRPAEVGVRARPQARAAVTRGPGFLALMQTAVFGLPDTDTTPPTIVMGLAGAP